MRDIAIYGAGGFGREVACLINAINKVNPTWNLIGFFDDGKNIGFKTEYGLVQGGLKELNNWNKPLSIVMAIANPCVLERIVVSITNQLVEFPNIIAPDVNFFDENSLIIGKGNLIGFRCLISCAVKIGDFNLFNNDIFIGHDTVIGSNNVFNPSVRISGEVVIGERNFMGVSSVILQQKKIGNDTTVGASSTIIRNTKDNCVYIGTPATILKY